MRALTFFAVLLLFASHQIVGQQQFYFGADLSYVNEMDDCGVVYKENNEAKDAYEIFADHNCNLARIRLWHTPAWYDTLNNGQRYSDYDDVKRSIGRARSNNMEVLLDFHLSDRWADPGHQIVPAAWADIVYDQEVIEDSLYNYVYRTLIDLDGQGLLPEMVQVGNETNKEILQSQEDNDAGWRLNWDRNAPLFNTAIRAVRDVQETVGKEIEIMIHVAGPSSALWLFDEFIEHGVTDFDIMGLSYYWAWHKPTSIAETGYIVHQLKANYPQYEVMIVETGYIWTFDHNDDANNIINETHPDYHPPSPEVQKEWLVDMTQEVINNGAIGVVYWEPAWVSSECWTPWGQGSHQEHATFFDFSNNLHNNGGIGWMTHNYDNITSTELIREPETLRLKVYPDSNHRSLIINTEWITTEDEIECSLFGNGGGIKASLNLGRNLVTGQTHTMDLPELSPSVYIFVAHSGGKVLYSQKIWLNGS